jgi:hypothetical protein
MEGAIVLLSMGLDLTISCSTIAYEEKRRSKIQYTRTSISHNAKKLAVMILYGVATFNLVRTVGGLAIHYLCSTENKGRGTTLLMKGHELVVTTKSLIHAQSVIYLLGSIECKSGTKAP